MMNVDKMIETLDFGIVMCKATGTSLVHIDLCDAEELKVYLSEQKKEGETRKERKDPGMGKVSVDDSLPEDKADVSSGTPVGKVEKWSASRPVEHHKDRSFGGK